MQKDTLFGIIGTAIGIISIILAMYFYKKSRKAKEPCWAIKSKNLIEGYNVKLDSLIVLYKGNQIENLTVSRICFWNDGKDTLERKDIETINHLRIAGKNGVMFLDVKILAQNNLSSQCNVDISDSGNYIYLDFDYIDQNQGCVIQVIHTGKLSGDIQILGDIKGVSVLQRKLTVPGWVDVTENPLIRDKHNSKLNLSRSILLNIGGSVAGAAVIYVYISYIISKIHNPALVSLPESVIVLTIFLLVYGIVSFISLTGDIRLLRSLKVTPKGLEIFNERF